ncbi:lysophospholipid acyltransferase family protein [Gammaproteobacteria bacterium]|nr:lysophospholipid acyltransferase family protein [Gammaproteobacteria bacterium]
MKILFTFLSIIPKSIYRLSIRTYLFTGLHTFTKSYKVTLSNIKIVRPLFTEAEAIKESRISYFESLLSIYETFYSWSRNPATINNNVLVVKNNFILQKYIQNQNGLVIVAIHNRSIDMLLSWINSQTKTVSLYKKIKLKALDKYVRKIRENKINKTFETSVAGVKKIFKSLKNNEVIAIASDQVPARGHGEYVEFFGRMAYTTTLVPRLAYKTKKPVIFCCLNSESNSDYLSINIEPSHQSLFDQSECLLSMNRSIEKLINNRVSDYSWEYKRFRRPMSGEIDPYKD